MCIRDSILAEVARPATDDWIRRHEADVESQYNPTIPAGELKACDEVYAEAKAAAEQAGDARGLVDLEEAYEAVRSYAGQQGTAELYGFWSAESTLLNVANRIG